MAPTPHVDYEPVLRCLSHEASDLMDSNAPDWITSYTRGSLARICDQLACDVLTGKLSLPLNCMPFCGFRIDIDAYEDTVVGWALLAALDPAGRDWTFINHFLPVAEHTHLEALLVDAMRGCLTPKHASYRLTYRTLGADLTSHDIIDLAARLQFPKASDK